MAHSCLCRPAVQNLTALGLHNGARGLGYTTLRAQVRPFSVAASRAALKQPKIQPLSGRTAPTESMKGALKEVNIRSFPNDIGLLPGTFISPRLQDYPWLDPVDLFKLEWRRVKTRFKDGLSSLIYKFMAKPRPNLERRKLAPTAKMLYRDMYTAFAEGDSETLKKICTSGLLANFSSRIASRGNESMKWEVIKMSSPRLMSNRSSRLPPDNSFIRQAVVKIKSRQRLTRYRADGSIVPGSGKEKDVVEYVVIQKRILLGEQEPWMIWGLIQPKTLAEIELEEAASE